MTNPVCSDSSEVPVFCVEKAGQPCDVLLRPRRGCWHCGRLKISNTQLSVLPDYQFHLLRLDKADDIIGPVANLKDGVKHEGSWTVLVAGLAIGALEVLLAVVRVWQKLAITRAGGAAGWVGG